MGFLDKLGKIDRRKVEMARQKLGDAVDKHGDKIAGGIDKAAQAADKRTGGKHHDAIAKGAAKAKEGLAKLDTNPGQGPAAGGPGGTGTDGPTR